MIDHDKKFHSFFPRYTFELKDFQKKVIDNVVTQGNTLCLFQTGGGKSLIYWLSGLELSGITIVVSPLTALIIDQANKLKNEGFNAVAISGNMPVKKQVKFFLDLANGKENVQFLFISPEKLATDGLLTKCLQRIKEKIRLFVIDEIHCVSQWGISFRPFYKRIPDFLDNIFGHDNWPKLLGLTATLNPYELKDICRYFNIDKANIIRQDLMMRGEIQLHIEKFSVEADKNTRLLELFKIHKNEKILVYVYRKYNKHGVEDLCQFANDNGYAATYFHGDMSADEREQIISKFKNNTVNIVFATNAFGMGIDIKDIRVVIHFMLPESVEQYYQEIGRAARDGYGANAYLFYSTKNISIKERYFIDGSFPTKKLLEKTFRKLVPTKGVYNPIQYFDDEEIQQCLPYFEECGLLKIAGKVFFDLTPLNNIIDKKLQTIYDSTRTKNLIFASVKLGEHPIDIANYIYDAVIDNKAVLDKPLDRALLLEFNEVTISDDKMEIMLASIEEKKKYKHELLDYFVRLISDFERSELLHQDIAAYLGTPKFYLKRIYKTIDNNLVRSKSEVLICNLLYASNIKYCYEKELKCPNGDRISPDFTIVLKDGSEIYWEHLGMIGVNSYDDNWMKKQDLYDKYFVGKLIYTYENANLSNDALLLIEKNIKPYL